MFDEGDDSGSGPQGDDGGRGGVRPGRLVPGPIRRSYALKFVVSLLLVVLVIAGGGWVSYVQIQGIIEDDAKSTLQSTATLQADSVSEWVAGMQTHTRAVASADVYAGSNATQIDAYLEESEDYVDGDVVGMHYVDPESERVVASTDDDLVGESVGSVTSAWLSPTRRAAAQGPGNTSVETSETAFEIDGELHMAFATRVRGGDGVLILVGDVQRDFEKLHETRPIVTTKVLDGRGYDVFTTRRSGIDQLARTAAFRSALTGDTVTYEPDHGRSILALAPVPNADWVVVTTAPKSELYQASETVGRNVILLVTSSVVVLGLVGIVLGRQTILPLVRLRRLTHQMEEGTLDVDFSTRRVDEIGRLFHSFANMRDALREQIREAEEARARAERSRSELERQNARLDQFASTVSHDLRNPLTVAQGNLELLLQDLRGADGDAAIDREETVDRLETVDDAHERIDAIIQDVLALAREGERIEETSVVGLETVAREAWSNVDNEAATLTVASTGTFQADRGRLLRALENLFRNAVDHVGEGVAVEVGCTEDGFYVADDGPGIPDEEAEDVFTFGYSAAEDGTGLGLAIVRTISEAHGWEVDLDCDYEEGARFVVSGVDWE